MSLAEIVQEDGKYRVRLTGKPHEHLASLFNTDEGSLQTEAWSSKAAAITAAKELLDPASGITHFTEEDRDALKQEINDL